MKYGFKKTINWNKYQSKVTIEKQEKYLDYLIDPSVQEVNRLILVLSFYNNKGRVEQDMHAIFFKKVEIKDYNVMINVEFFLVKY